MLATARATASDCTLHEVLRPAEFASLQNEWSELLSSSNSDCLFLSWEWLHTWWKHLAEDLRLSILTVRRGDELIGIAPFCTRPRNLRKGRPFRLTEFLGTGQVGSDYLDVISRVDCEREVYEALAIHLAARPVVLKWTQLKGLGSAAADIALRLKGRSWSVVDAKTASCPFIRLSNITWDSYIASLGPAHRYDFRRKWNRLHRDYAVRFEEVATSIRSRQALDLLVEQHNTRWSTRGGSDAFHTASLVAFHHDFVQVALERGWLRLYVLWLNEKPAAHLYGFRYGGSFSFYQSSFDAAFEKYSVGAVLMAHAIKSAIEEGAGEFDLLHGTETYKSHWSRESRDLIRLELFPPGGVGSICRASLSAARATRAMARRMLPRSLVL